MNTTILGLMRELVDGKNGSTAPVLAALRRHAPKLLKEIRDAIADDPAVPRVRRTQRRDALHDTLLIVAVELAAMAEFLKTHDADELGEFGASTYALTAYGAVHDLLWADLNGGGK